MEERSIFYLVIEDDPDDFFLLQRALKASDAEGQIVRAGSGYAAFDLLEHLPLNRVCVICDLQLPEMSGLELLCRIRAELPQLPRFAFLTACTNPKILDQLQVSGADAVFQKPADFGGWQELAREVHNLCSSREPVNH
jgi:CheY-like chemotaxis protein